MIDADARRPADVPADLSPAWDLLERGAVRGIVADVDGGILWTARSSSERHLALAEALDRDGGLDRSLSPETFVVVRERAGERAAAGARLADVWSDIPEWCHPGRTREDVVAMELRLIAEDTVPDPDVALFLSAAAAARLPISAMSDGLLTADQVRRRLEHPVLDAVPWRSVLRTAGPDTDFPTESLPAPQDDYRPLLLLCAKPREAHDGELVLRLGQPGVSSAAVTERLANRLRGSAELAALPHTLRPAWLEGATVLGPALIGFAEWSIHHALGLPGPLFWVGEPGGLMPELLAELLRDRDLTLPVIALPVTTEMLVATDPRAGGPTEIALTLALGNGLSPADVARLLGVGTGPEDLPSLIETLATDVETHAKARTHAEKLRQGILSRTPGSPEVPLTLCQVGGPATVQRQLAELLRANGTPRHVVGLHLLSGRLAADAVLGGSGGEVRGYLAGLGLPEDGHGRAAAWRTRFEVVAGIPDRARTSLTDSEPYPDDLHALETEAARSGVRAALRQYLRLRALAGSPVDFTHGGNRLAASLPALPPAQVTVEPTDVGPPDWIGPTIGVLEREVASARVELALRNSVVASRAYRFVLRLRRLARGRRTL